MRKQDNTRNVILDAAEICFGADGFDVVTSRAIAAKAGVPLGLINYHFGTKEKLFVDVIGRRAGELHSRRRNALNALGDPRACGVEAILEAFLRPYIDLMSKGGPGWRAYGQVMARNAHSKRWSKLISRHFRDNANMFADALVAADPRLTREMAARGYAHVVSVSIGLIARDETLEILFDQHYSNRDLERAYRFMLPYLTGAFRGLAEARELRSG